MAKRALLIGSQTGGLQGPIGDVQRLAGELAHWSFLVDLRTTEAEASRDGILTAYRRLIDETRDGDAALVYYSGHGARAVADVPRELPPGMPTSFQAIVPTDYDASTPDDFRGILDVELSVLLAQLTARTRNATVLLDCCHAAAMSRDAAARPKSLFHARHIDLARHLERMTAAGLAVDRLSGTDNPDAVRLVAAGRSQSAYERPVGDAAVGTFTESVVGVLAEARDARMTWEALGSAVRERVLDFHPSQRVEIEGPRRRYLFEIERAPSAGMFGIVPGNRHGQAILRAGRLHGVHRGDVYAVVRADASDDVEGRIADATVARVDPTTSTADVQLRPPATALAPGLLAVPHRLAAPTRAIELTAAPPERDAIAKALEATGRFTAVEPGGAGPVLAAIALAGGQLALTAPAGVPVIPPAPMSAASLDLLVRYLRRLTAAQSLRELAGDPDGLPDAALEVSWGKVEHGQPITLAPAGALLAVGDWFFVRAVNRHPQKKRLYVSVFDIGVAQRIQQLTDGWPSGYELDPGEELMVGRASNGRLDGIELGWASELPEDLARTESLVVLATEQPTDLGSLETPAPNAATPRAGPQPLAQLVHQIQHGTARDAAGRDRREVGYVVRHIDFELSPWPVAAPHSAFAIDERPPGSVRLFAPRAARPARKLAIRITGLEVHDTRSWLGSSDIRLDTLVITRAGAGGERPYRAETSRFKAVRDGERLPLDNALIYHGDVREFVDLRVWLSRDLEHSRTLSELLADEASSPELQTAAAAVLATTPAAASAAPIVAAIGGAATLTAIAWRVLSAALTRSIGIYQTSLLAGEGDGFGIGRHPAHGMFRAQGFSFGYEVIAV